jgi:large subunit ribosomal protein L25
MEKMEKVVLKATRRDVTGKQVKAMRRGGQLPGVLYGRRMEKPVAIALDAHSASLALSRVTSSSLVTIELEGKEYPALVRERQRDFLKNRLLHVDFLAVSLDEKLRATVRVELTGTSLAVKDYSAILVNGLTELEVECLPADLPERITVDISPLVKIGDGIHVRDLVFSEKIKVLSSPDEMIVNATAPAKEEEVVVEAVPGVVEEPEVIEKGKKEEEVPEEEAKKEKE